MNIRAENKNTVGQQESLLQFIDSMASHFLDHPGFMWTGDGFEVLHADWPAYPIGHGIRNALSRFADFPLDTQFSAIDNIDQCTLFIVKGIRHGGEYDKRNYHIALWDEDIRKLAQNNFISGVTIVEDELEYHEDHISLIDKGVKATLFYELAYDIHPEIVALVEEFILMGRYDTAIREADLLLEMRLREATGTKDFGQKLVDKCFGEDGLLLPASLPNSSRLEMRAIFRRFFNYVRNDFAHNFSSISLVTTVRLLRRCSRLLELVAKLKKEMSK